MRETLEPVDTLRHKLMGMYGLFRDKVRSIHGSKVDALPPEAVLAMIAQAFPDEFRAIQSNLYALPDVVSRQAVPFIIRDPELVDAALEARISGTIAPKDLNFPFESLLIQVPRRPIVGEGRAGFYDVVQISNRQANMLDRATGKIGEERRPFMIVMFYDSCLDTFDAFREGGSMTLDKIAGFAQDEIVTNSEMTGSTPDPTATMTAIKLGLFLASMHQDTCVCQRTKNKKASGAFKHRYPQYREIKIKLSDLQQRYERDPDAEEDGTDRQKCIRHRVRGHYKHYKVGKPIRFCPPHWRGQLGGPLREQPVYEVKA
jgi:hypothetical protein